MEIFDPEIKLETDRVRLRPIHPDDVSAFAQIALEPRLWRYMPLLVDSAEKAHEYVQSGLDDWQNRSRMMFVIFSKAHQQLVGSTSIGALALEHQRAEIGWTWLTPETQGTGLNKHCKYLLLQYCFDQLGLIRVEFKTDVNNTQSRKAMLKIGCTEEGVLRSHTLLSNGTRRDSIYYSILNHEWPNIKQTIFSEF